MINTIRFKETELGMIPQEWEVLELDKVIESLIDYRGKTPTKTIKGIPLITAKVVKKGRIDYDNLEYIDEDDFSTWMTRGIPEPGDIVLTTEAPLGEVAQLDDRKIALAQRIITLRGKKDILYNGYLKYYFLSKIGRDSLCSRETGSVVTGIKQSTLRKIPIILPPYEVQKQIAEILDSIDDKIDLLCEQNKTLEDIGKTTFNEWFGKYNVENELPEGWRIGKLGEEFNILMGQSPDGSSYNEIGEGSIFFQGRAEFQERFPKPRLYTNKPQRIADKNDVLVSVRAPVGDINVAFDHCCIGRGLAAIKSSNQSYCLYKIMSIKNALNKFNAEGTVFGSINKDAFSNIEVIIPEEGSIELFEKMTSPFDEKIFANYQSIQVLNEIRNNLLLRLISGKIRII